MLMTILNRLLICVGYTDLMYSLISNLTTTLLIDYNKYIIVNFKGVIMSKLITKIQNRLKGKEIKKTGNHWASGYIDYAKEKGYFS